jgi:thymidylate synthase (FAD)
MMAEMAYFDLLKNGATPQEARDILPHSVKTTLVMTTNLREWRQIFKLRTSPAAHPQMREIMIPALKAAKEIFPIVFDDIEVEDYDC